MSHRIISRSEWGARHQGGFYDRPVGNLRRYLHHSVTIAPDLVPPFTDDYAAVRELEEIGEERFGGGISYTFAITPAGLVFEGHGIGRTGAHTAGYNTIAAGICLIGNYEKDEPTPQQLAALDWLLHEGVRRRWWTSPTLTGGHRDTKSTACPGKHAYAEIPAINAGKYHGTTPAPEKETGFMSDAAVKSQIKKTLWNARMAKANTDTLVPMVRSQGAAISALAKTVGELGGLDPEAVLAVVDGNMKDFLGGLVEEGVNLTISVEPDDE